MELTNNTGAKVEGNLAGLAGIAEKVRGLPSRCDADSGEKVSIMDMATDAIVLAGGDRLATQGLFRKIQKDGLGRLTSSWETDPGYDYLLGGGFLPGYAKPNIPSLFLMPEQYSALVSEANERQKWDLPGYVHELAFTMKKGFRKGYGLEGGSYWSPLDGELVSDLSANEIITLKGRGAGLNIGGVKFNPDRYVFVIDARDEPLAKIPKYGKAEELVKSMISDQAQYLATLVEKMDTFPQGDLISWERVKFDPSKLDGGITEGVDAKSKCARQLVGATTGLQGLMDLWQGWKEHKAEKI